MFLSITSSIPRHTVRSLGKTYETNLQDGMSNTYIIYIYIYMFHAVGPGAWPKSINTLGSHWFHFGTNWNNLDLESILTSGLNNYEMRRPHQSYQSDPAPAQVGSSALKVTKVFLFTVILPVPAVSAQLWPGPLYYVWDRRRYDFEMHKLDLLSNTEMRALLRRLNS